MMLQVHAPCRPSTFLRRQPGARCSTVSTLNHRASRLKTVSSTNAPGYFDEWRGSLDDNEDPVDVEMELHRNAFSVTLRPAKVARLPSRRPGHRHRRNDEDDDITHNSDMSSSSSSTTGGSSKPMERWQPSSNSSAWSVYMPQAADAEAGAPVHQGVLMARLTSARNSSDLCHRVAPHAAVMTEVHVLAALHKLMKLEEGFFEAGMPPQRLTDRMTQLLDMLLRTQPGKGLPRLDLLDSRGMVTTARLIVRGKCEGHPAFGRLLVRLCAHDHRALCHCDAHALSCAAWAAASATLNGSGAVAEDQLTGLLSAIEAAWLDGAGGGACLKDVAYLAWSFTKTSRLGAGFARHLCDQVAKMDPGTADPHSLSILMWALALANIVDLPVTKAARLQAEQRGLRGWTATGLAGLVWAVAATADSSGGAQLSQASSSPALVALFGGAAAVILGGKAGGTPSSAWAKVLWAAATVRLSMPALFAAAAQRIKSHPACFFPPDLSRVLWAFGVAAPPESLESLLDSAEGYITSLLDSSDQGQLGVAAWALAVAGGVSSAATARGRLARALLAAAGRREVLSLTESTLSQLQLLALEVGAGVDASSLLSPQLWEAASAARHARPRHALGSSRHVCNLLCRMGLDARLEQRSPCTNFVVNIEVRLPCAGAASLRSHASAVRRYVAVPVVVNGPSSVMSNAHTLPDGASRLRDRQLQRSYGAPVVVVNLATDWHGRRDEERARMLCLKLGLDASKLAGFQTGI